MNVLHIFELMKHLNIKFYTMKTKLGLLAALVLVLSVIASAKIKDGQAMTGNSLSDMGAYTITHADAPIIHDNAVLETYDLVYENAEQCRKNWCVRREKNVKHSLFVTTSSKFSTHARMVFLV